MPELTLKLDPSERVIGIGQDAAEASRQRWLAKDEADRSEAEADRAETEKLGSESARDAAIAYLNPYADQAAGEAATNEGELFSYLDGNDEVALAKRTAGGSTLLPAYFGSSKVGFGETTVSARLSKTPEYYGATADGVTDDSSDFSSAISAQARGPIVVNGTYAASDVFLGNAGIEGKGRINALAGASYVLGLGRDSSDGWRYRRIADVYINGSSKTSEGVRFTNNGSNNEIAGRWILDGVYIKDCTKGISKPYGNIGNIIRGCSLKNNDFGYHSKGQASPAMHGGADLIEGGEISGSALAGIYIDSSVTGTGGTTIKGTVIENNPGFGIFVKSWASSVVPLVLDSVWLENNGTAGSVTIDSTSYTPRYIYMKDTVYAIIRGSQIRSSEFINSNVLMDSCFFDAITSVTTSSNPTLRAINANIDGMKGQSAVLIESVSKSIRLAGSAAASWWAPNRSVKARGLGTAGIVASFSGRQTYSMSGTATINSTQVNDGLLYPRCAEWTLPDTNVALYGSYSITSGKWYVYTIGVKAVSGSMPRIRFISGTNLAQDLQNSYTGTGWRTLGGIAKANASGTVSLRFDNNTGASSTFRTAELQVVEFDTEAQALEFYNRGHFLASEVMENSGTATDTTDANGNITIAHGLSRTPTLADISIVGDNQYIAKVQSLGASNITVLVKDAAGADVVSTSVTVGWRAEV